MKINFPKKEKNFQKKSFIYYIKFYWQIAIFVVFIFSLSFFVFGYYLFIETNKEIITPTLDIGEQTNLVTKERINKTLKYFSLREQKSSQIIYSSSPIVDPSL